jgi:hypothetical protein
MPDPQLRYLAKGDTGSVRVPATPKIFIPRESRSKTISKAGANRADGTNRRDDQLR